MRDEVARLNAASLPVTASVAAALAGPLDPCEPVRLEEVEEDLRD